MAFHGFLGRIIGFGQHLGCKTSSYRKYITYSCNTIAITHNLLFHTFEQIKTTMYHILAQLNKIILPSFTKQGVDISKAKKWQMAIIGYRYYVTKRAL